MEQTPPFSNPTTSYAAARSMTARVPNIRERVFSLIKASGGMTADAIEAELGMSHQTVSARVNELARLGQIHDSGRRRPTRSGRNAIVWSVRA